MAVFLVVRVIFGMLRVLSTGRRPGGCRSTGPTSGGADAFTSVARKFVPGPMNAGGAADVHPVGIRERRG
jgi:hypothetical protein